MAVSKDWIDVITRFIVPPILGIFLMSTIASADDVQSCIAGSRSERISSCTQLIISPASSANDRAGALKNRGDAQATEHYYSAAILDYTRAIELRPNYAQAYQARGMVYGVIGDVKSAVTDLKQATVIQPSFAIAFKNLGRVYARADDCSRAIDQFNRAIQIFTEFGQSYSWRAYCEQKMGNPEAALRDYNRAILLDPTDPGDWTLRGYVQYILRNYESAIGDLNHAIELKSDDQNGKVLAYGYRSMSLLARGYINLADADFEKAIKLDPTHTLFLDRYRNAYCNDRKTAKNSPLPAFCQ